MSPIEIRIELLRRSITMQAIADQVGVTIMAVSMVIHRRFVSRRIMQAVATAIGREPHEVFPEYGGFARDGLDAAPKNLINAS